MRETFFMFYTIFLLLHFRTDAACLSPSPTSTWYMRDGSWGDDGERWPDPYFQ